MKDLAADASPAAAAAAAAAARMLCAPDSSCKTHPSKAGVDLTPTSAAVCIPASRSIYDLFSSRKRYFMLAVCAAAAALAPLADTVYIPSLYSIRGDLRTTEALVAATVAIYMFMVGLAALVWGPASDRYGRRPILLISTVSFVAFTLGCYFVPNIYLLIPLRGLQGASAAAYGSTANGVLADTFPPHLRGTALGFSTIPLLIGPLLGPVLGGGLAQAFGWRSTFIAITLVAGAIILPLLLFGVPETHQYKNLMRLHKRDPQAAVAIREADQIRRRVPRFQAPWYPYKILLDRYVILHALSAFITFGSMFCSVTQLPIVLAQPPYNLSTGLIGIACLSASAAGIVAAPLGGRLADYSAAVHGPEAHPLQRLLYNNLLNLFIKPVGLLLYGWSSEFKLHLALLLTGLFLVGVSNNLYMPGIFSFVTNYKEQAAAAAAAGIHSVMCVASGVLIVFGAVAVQTVGVGPFFTLLAGLNFFVSLAAAYQIFVCSGVHNWQQLRQFSSHSFKNLSKDIHGAGAAAAASVE